MTVTAWIFVGVLAVAGTIASWWCWRQTQMVAELRGELDEVKRRLQRNSELEGQLAQALDAMDLGVVLRRADGRQVFRNAAAESFAFARHGEALVERAIEELLDASLVGQVAEREVELYGPPLRAFVVRSFPLWSDGESTTPIGALALVEEATERRRVDQVRRDFVANISHELRTPVGALGLLAETIQDEPDPETLRRLAGRMVTEADRVARTIEDLLELSRIEFGDETYVDDVDLVSVVEEAISRIGTAAEHRRVGIVVTDQTPAVIRGDRRQLVSALYNLLDNAVKFSPNGAIVEVSVARDDGRARLSVTDHGVGIPSRDLDRIFERFYRVDRARSRETGGTGLGLAIVRHVVANHGGEINVRSVEGEGSQFTLSLPLGSSSPEIPQSVEVAR